MALLWEPDFSQSTVELMGFTDSLDATDPDGRTIRTVETGEGPSGLNTVRFTHIPISEAEVGVIGNTQNTHGSKIAGGSYTGVAQGTSFWIHMYLRLVTLEDLLAYNPPPEAPTTTADALTYKQSIWGNNAGGNDARLILQSKFGNFYGGWRVFPADNIDSGPEVDFDVADGWVALSIEARSASTIGGSDGYFKVWLNVETSAAVTAERTGVQIDSVDAATGLDRLWTGFNFNEFGNETIAEDTPNPQLVYEIGGLQLRDDANTTWFADMTEGGEPAAATAFGIGLGEF
jgi:hypothetical protein